MDLDLVLATYQVISQWRPKAGMHIHISQFGQQAIILARIKAAEAPVHFSK